MTMTVLLGFLRRGDVPLCFECRLNMRTPPCCLLCVGPTAAASVSNSSSSSCSSIVPSPSSSSLSFGWACNCSNKKQHCWGLKREHKLFATNFDRLLTEDVQKVKAKILSQLVVVKTCYDDL